AEPQTVMRPIEEQPKFIEQPRPVAAQPVVIPAPTRIKYVPPQYPYEARVDGIEGWVDIDIDITATGDVMNPRIRGAQRKDLFGRPALAAVRQWQYSPRVEADTRTTRPMSVRVEFKINN